MKIILSRKGFDSTAGGVPSPILPDGRLVSLPIPDARSPVRYGEIGGAGREIGALVSNLTRGKIRRNSRAHLDPDLVMADRPREAGWRPLFGQEGAAQGHLANEGVGPGDLFVFFGLFQPVIRRRGRFVFDRRAPRRHVIWGWLQVQRVVAVDDCSADVRRWAIDHPHLRHVGSSNTLYIARKTMTGSGLSSLSLPGAGVFERYRRLLCLTDPAGTRPSHWRLPAWMMPGHLKRPLSYHRRMERWSSSNGLVRLESAARGQEFVLSAPDYPEALAWLFRVIGRYGSGSKFVMERKI